MIDWERPIEAVRKSDGLIFPVTFCYQDGKNFCTNETPNISETNSFWYEDGRDYCSEDKWFIRNKEVIDWTKPLELVDGRKAQFVELDSDGDAVVLLEGEVTSRSYNLDGSHYFGELPNIRNVQEPATPDQAKDIIRALLQYSTPMSGLLGVIAREAGERYIND